MPNATRVQGSFKAFPNKQFHLSTYYHRWANLCEKKAARSYSKSKLKEVREFLEEHAASIEFEFFWVVHDDDDAVDTNKVDWLRRFEGYADLVDPDIIDDDDTPWALIINNPANNQRQGMWIMS